MLGCKQRLLLSPCPPGHRAWASEGRGVMTRFQLVFRRDGEVTRSEFHASSFENEPHIDGRLLIDGGTYPIRGVEWLLRREDVGDGPRFVCTPLGEPAAA